MTENELFEACMNWVKAATNLNNLTRKDVEDHLGELFHEIRFKLMSVQQFATLIPTYGDLFTIDEYKEISQSFACPEFKPNTFSGRIRATSENMDFNWGN